MCGRGIRSHPTHGLLRRSGWRCDWPSCGRQLVEASERVGGAVGIKPFDAGRAAVGSEDAQREALGLVRPAAGAVGAAKDRGYEERVKLQGEDIVDADGVGRGEIEQSAQVPQELLRAP